ncbi:hypothetical protein [Paraburkholderia tropica]|uniref:hypothetical protein n=1 Tax=Paraburkholderia tropica TaxID=92647 RepID=UPI002AB17827|nr:hypothetical protein [Paraburkholderia tropica]
MDALEAKILFKNLLNRIKKTDDGEYQLSGLVTQDEVNALRFALDNLSGAAAPPASPPLSSGATPTGAGGAANQTSLVEPDENVVVEEPAVAGLDEARAVLEKAAATGGRKAPDINLTVLDLPPPECDARVCLDFGTAMSKASLVEDDARTGSEDITVLTLGVPGNQEEVSETMLISSVYIANDGLLWFGKAAVDHSLLEAADGSRQRLDNIKRRLSEDGLNEKVGEVFNPIARDVEIVYGDVVLAYLTFLTWAMNQCLDDIGLPRNIVRRFAMPCLPSDKARETAHRLRALLGEAQVLADTFADRLTGGLPLADFVATLHELRQKGLKYSYVGEDITEPLGVAGSLLKQSSRMDALVMVVDVGAGTSDLSLYRIAVDPNREINTSLEVKDAAIGITEAGNHLDRLLVGFILKKAGITTDHPDCVKIQRKLELSIRDYKETLFNESFVTIPLPEFGDPMIELEEFRQLNQVVSFGDSLKRTMQQILEQVDDSWTDWIMADPQRHLTVALTGGGASLPMVKDLTKGNITVRGKSIRLVPSVPFPGWLHDDYPELEADYSRIAVSLGGARKRLIERSGTASVAAGGVRTTPKLGGYYQKG